MIEGSRHRTPPKPDARGVLHLNGEPVGEVRVIGGDAAWTYAVFTPGERFARFAPIFGRWSLLMHEDEHAPLTPAASEALRDAEQLMDTLHARVHFPNDDAWHEIGQLNIDGDRVEWQEL